MARKTLSRRASEPKNPPANMERTWQPIVYSVLEIILAFLILSAHLWRWWQWVGLAECREIASLIMVALLGILLTTSFLRLPESIETLGLSPKNILNGWKSLLVFNVLCLTVLLIVSLFCGEMSLSWTLRVCGWLPSYIVGVIAQQFTLQSFVNNRIYRLFSGTSPKRRIWYAVVLSSLIFILLHIPNIPLMALVLVACPFWTWHFRRFANLPALIASHIILGTATMILIGDEKLQHLRVGWGLMKRILEN